jgi:DNA-binding SARP family transcriptional activator
VALSLTLLGGFQARLDSGSAVSLPVRKSQALLAYLGIRPGRAHPRDKVAALLWGESSDERARDGLRHALAALRRALPASTPPILLLEGQTLALSSAVVDVDVPTFERHVAEGTPEALEHAAAVYGGDLLSGFSLDEPLFEEWLVPERERLRELALEALARLLACQSKTGATERAIQTAVRLLALDPLQEAVHRALMRLYLRQHRRGAALRQYQLCVDVLQRELGSEPEPETKQLYLELLRHHPAKTEKAPLAWPASRHGDAPARVELPGTDTPLFGREADRARLSQALDEAAHGRGQLVVLVGEAGIGKTSLLGAFAADAVSTHARVLLGRCHESTQILPFGPWIDALWAGAVLADDALLGTLDPAWRAELTRLFPEIAGPGLPPSSDNALRLFESVARLLEHLAATQPLVLLLEDVHWADEMSLRLLAFMARRLPSRRVLLVATSRDEELADAPAARRTVDEISREPHVTRATLAPLIRRDTLDLIRSLARVHGEPGTMARLEEHVWTVSEGNPFVAVETTRAFLDGTLPPNAGTWLIPERVRELISVRLERLSGHARALAAVAAVIGREFDFRLLQRASGLEEDAAAEGVEELVRRQVLRGIGERFDFAHDRIRAVVIEQILSPRRKLLERRAGEAIEAVFATNIEPHTLSLGLHYLRGEAWDRAVTFLQRAGLAAGGRSAYQEAVACFDQALSALGHLPEGQETARRAIGLRLDLHSMHAVLGNVDQMFSLLREAEPIAAGLGDRRLEARVASQMALCLWWTGHPLLAAEAGQRALAMAEALSDVELEVVTRVRLANARMDLGDYPRAIALYERNLEVLVGDLARVRFDMSAVPGVSCRGFLATCLALLGHFARARATMAEALEIAHATDHPYTVAWAHTEAGRLRIIQGDWESAIERLERGLELCRRDGFAYLFPNTATFLGTAYTRCGRIAEGIALLEEAVEQSATIKYMASQPRGAAHLAEGYLLVGRFHDALRSGRRALELSRRNGQRGFEAEAMRILGEVVASRAGQEGDASALFHESLALARELGMRPLEARCQLGLGRLCRAASRRSAAGAHLATARTMLADMQMRFWLEQAEAELAQLAR